MCKATLLEYIKLALTLGKFIIDDAAQNLLALISYNNVFHIDNPFKQSVLWLYIRLNAVFANIV